MGCLRVRRLLQQRGVLQMQLFGPHFEIWLEYVEDKFAPICGRRQQARNTQFQYQMGDKNAKRIVSKRHTPVVIVIPTVNTALLLSSVIERDAGSDFGNEFLFLCLNELDFNLSEWNCIGFLSKTNFVSSNFASLLSNSTAFFASLLSNSTAFFASLLSNNTAFFASLLSKTFFASLLSKAILAQRCEIGSHGGNVVEIANGFGHFFIQTRRKQSFSTQNELERG